MRPKMQANIAVALVWLGAIISLFGNTIGRWCLWTGLAVCIAGLIYRTVMVRCPLCGKSIDGFQSLPTHCPHCGETLD